MGEMLDLSSCAENVGALADAEWEVFLTGYSGTDFIENLYKN